VRRVVPHTTGCRLEFEATVVLEDVAAGDSIAVNGCCLTVVEHGDGWWAVDAVEETLRRTCLGALRAGDPVNLERPVRLIDRLGGHLVQGHVDDVGHIVERSPGADGSALVVIQSPARLLRYLVEKGSVAVDGVSLTVAAVGADWFELALIPETLARTTLGHRAVGSYVNVEIDPLARYAFEAVERMRARS